MDAAPPTEPNPYAPPRAPTRPPRPAESAGPSALEVLLAVVGAGAVGLLTFGAVAGLVGWAGLAIVGAIEGLSGGMAGWLALGLAAIAGLGAAAPVARSVFRWVLAPPVPSPPADSGPP